MTSRQTACMEDFDNQYITIHVWKRYLHKQYITIMTTHLKYYELGVSHNIMFMLLSYVHAQQQVERLIVHAVSRHKFCLSICLWAQKNERLIRGSVQALLAAHKSEMKFCVPHE